MPTILDGITGVTLAGGWGQTGVTNQSYNGENVNYDGAGSGSDTARWAFTGLTNGATYWIALCWDPFSNRATNTPWRIFDGSGTLTSGTINQQNTPTADYVAGSTNANFQKLTGSPVTLTSGTTLTVEINNNANNYVIADAALLQISSPTTATLSGATSGTVGNPVTYTVTLDAPVASGTVSCPISNDKGWTVTGSPISIGVGQSTGTCTVTPTTVDTATITLGTTTPSLTLAGTPISLTATNTATLTGPTKGHISIASQPFYITLNQPAGVGGVSCPVTTSNGTLSQSSPIVIAQGDSLATFNVTPDSTPRTVTVTLGAITGFTIVGSPISYVTAASYAYTSIKSGNWNDVTVWDGGVPISGDTATIAAGHTITIPNSYAATIGATGQATAYTALTIDATGLLVIGGGTSGQLNLQGDIAMADVQPSVVTILTITAGGTLKFVPSNAQRIKVSKSLGGLIAINGTSGHRCAVLTDATALSGGGLKGYLEGYSTGSFSSGATTVAYCDFTDLGDGSTNGMISCNCLTGLPFSLTQSTFTRCEGVTLAMTDSSQSCTVQRNTWTSSVGTVFDNGRLVNLKISNTTDSTGGTRLVDSNLFDMMLEMIDGRGFTFSNNTWSNVATAQSSVTGTDNLTDGKSWAAFSNNLVYGKPGSNVPMVVAGGNVSGNLLLHASTGSTFLNFVTAPATMGAVFDKNIAEVSAMTSPTELYFAYGQTSTSGGPYTHTFRFNLLLPPPLISTTSWQLDQFNGWNSPGFLGVLEHNTVWAGVDKSVVQYDETSSHTQWLTSYKGNLLFNTGTPTASLSYHFRDEGGFTAGGLVDFCLAANADYNATYGFFRDMPGNGQAGFYSGSGTVHTIAGCANNGAGLIRVTTTTAHGLSNGATVYIEGVLGTTEANSTGAAKWTISNASGSIFDLNGSTFTNTYTGGGRACTTYPFAGNGYQSHFSGGFAGANDVADGDPLFVDRTRNVGTWYTSPTGANQTTTGTYEGDVAAAVAYIAGNPAIDPADQIATRIASCKNWIMAGLRPSRAALTGVTGTLDTAQSYTTDAAGNALAGTVGAMAFLSPNPTTATLSGPSSGALNIASTAFTVTLDKPAGIGGVVVAVTSTEYNDTFS